MVRPLPVFENWGSSKLIYHFPGMKALDHEVQKALDRFEKMIRSSDVTQYVMLEPESVFFFF